MTPKQIARFAAAGLLGAFISVVVNAADWKYFFTFTTAGILVLGAFVGIVYDYFYCEWKFSNKLMAAVTGYAIEDFVVALLQKLST